MSKLEKIKYHPLIRCGEGKAFERDNEVMEMIRKAKGIPRII